jgi:hypothetical protein
LFGLGLFVSPMPPSYLVAWFILFVITNATVILGRLVYLVCHQPSSYWLLGLSFKTTVPLTVKAKPTKTFPVKENCHTIKSAGVHAFHPHLSFCLKLAHFIPAFHILSSFDPYESPPFDISPGDKRGNPRRCCYVSRPTTQRLQQAASQRSALQQ